MRPLLIRITRPSTRPHGFLRGYWGVSVYRPTRPDFDPRLFEHACEGGATLDQFAARSLADAIAILRERRETYVPLRIDHAVDCRWRAGAECDCNMEAEADNG